MIRPMTVYELVASDAPTCIRYVGMTGLPFNTRARLHQVCPTNPKMRAWFGAVKSRRAKVGAVTLGRYSNLAGAARGERCWFDLLSWYSELLNGVVPGTNQRLAA